MKTLQKMDLQYRDCLDKWRTAQSMIIGISSKNVLRDRRKLQKEYEDKLAVWEKDKQRLEYEM